ncbi:coiled-coil domain-containing protein 180 [Triplophysa dalaica]|uniref:coiled-coil domain-containing protein 180 n=1 Tax=Triplophysa dalaica TaxID=1582913 RepID=UPI0024DFB1DF|nr:coiled-coil domain-containing protein 180 [Triplophysa dalaica]XP_056606907.1 coiled-coil domain-containing protein 180 [Triplophysa dalaica]XP_056606908.1 coiled-coil domain-containing protein 180 [Triplophysa dalaica]
MDGQHEKDQFSMAHYDSRRRRTLDVGGDAAGYGTQRMSGNINFSTRNRLFSQIRHAKRSTDQCDEADIWGLPDTIAEKKNSDIIHHLVEKRRKDHNEAVSMMQMDLSSISVDFEALFRETAKDFLQKWSKNKDSFENVSDLTAHSYQDTSDIWNKACHTSFLMRQWIKEQDEIYARFESERKIKISAVLRKYSTKLEKISYLMPYDVHRLLDNTAMMINQALLANRCALAKLSLNWMEKYLQMDVFQRLRCEDKLQNWQKNLTS